MVQAPQDKQGVCNQVGPAPHLPAEIPHLGLRGLAPKLLRQQPEVQGNLAGLAGEEHHFIAHPQGPQKQVEKAQPVFCDPQQYEHRSHLPLRLFFALS